MPFMGRRIGAYFFWFVFFVRAKKMNSPSGAMTGDFDFDLNPQITFHVIGLPHHNHAAPRTPLESPNFGGTIKVLTTSEKTYFGNNFGTLV